MAGLAEASFKKSESALKEKHIPIRVHPRPFAVEKGRKAENGRFWARKSRFWVKNGPKTAFSGGFSPFFACAARCGSFPLTSFCPKRSLRPAKRDFYARREGKRRGPADDGTRKVKWVNA